VPTATEPSVANEGATHEVTHATSLTADDVGRGLAEGPRSEAPAIPAIETTMVIAIEGQHAPRPPEALATAAVLTFTSTSLASGASQFQIGWVPGGSDSGNPTITEVVGW